MKKFLFNKLTLWVDGFTNSSVGMSGKKLTACAVTLTAICFPVVLWSIWAYKHNDWSLLIGVLTIIVAFVSGLFAINTWDKKANGQSSTITENETK
jgi:Na+(H+)/acetate symporter ActP